MFCKLQVCILLTALIMADTSVSDNEGVPLQPDQSSGSTLLPKFNEVMISFRSIYISWSIPYFPLRTSLLYKKDKEDLNSIQLGSGSRNYTLESLEPGTSYEIVLQVYYTSADVYNIRKLVTTVPVLPPAMNEDMKVEIQLKLKQTDESAETISKRLVTQVKDTTVEYDDVANIFVYSIRKQKNGIYVVIYMNILQHTSAHGVFYRIKDSLATLQANHLGFSFTIYQGCCKSLYYHSFDTAASPNTDDLLKLRIIPKTAFLLGKCQNSLDMTKADISVQTYGQHWLNAITISLFIKLNDVRGLHPVVSAVNYNTQLRLEVQEGRVVWMFYNIHNSQGFIVSTKIILKQDVWKHVLVDYNALTGVGKIHIDGLIQSKTLSHVALSSNWMLGLRIGKYYSGGIDYKMNGYLDNLHIFGCTMPLQQIQFLASTCIEYKCNEKFEGPKLTVFTEKKKLSESQSEIKKVASNKEVCNTAGTVSGGNKAQCECKKNVEGKFCDKCKGGTFNLRETNPDGCISCFCNGLTNHCRSAKLEREQIILNANDIRNLSLQTINKQKAQNEDLLYNPLTNSISYKSFTSSQSKSIYYWELPLRYCGDKVGSYGGNLRYTISYLSRPIDKPLYAADVILVGNNLKLLYTEGKDPLPGQQHYYQIVLEERFWQLENGEKVSREQMIVALAEIQTLLLRATFSTEMIETSLYEVRFDVAGYNPLSSNNKVAPMVEECNCPAEYFGTSCQHCNKGYTKIQDGNFLGRCKQCECNGHANDCDGKTGECRNCEHYTTGKHCELCLPGYYGDPRSGRPDACKACPCPLTIKTNQFSSTCVLARDGQPTCDSCQQGYTGRQCERCGLPYIGNPMMPGDYCKIPKESKCEDCNRKGTVDSICDKTTGYCVCKKYVAGQKCDRCKKNTFYLHESNKDGCLNCWCFGVSDSCRTARYYRQTIKLKSVESALKITDIDETLDIRQGFYNRGTKELVLSNVDQLPSTVLYWSLPKLFLGSKVTSYGGHIMYTLSYDALATGIPYTATDIKLVGNNKVLQFGNQVLIGNRKVKDVKAVLKEGAWTTLSGAVASRDDLMLVLSNLQTILVRATYSSRTRQTSVSNIEISEAVPFNLRLGRAEEVERCVCPRGYTGLSCQKCEQGYTRHVDENGRLGCRKCECHRHSLECDQETGTCIQCQHNTKGERCHECQTGFYGDAKSGQCKACACPLYIQTNQFSETCVLAQDGGYVCDACQQGYDGRNCGKCAEGYTGNPLTPGGNCKESSQRYETTPSVEIVPSSRQDRVGTTAKFVCTVRGAQPLKLQWSRIDGRPFSKRVKVKTEGNKLTLTIRDLRLSDHETYICSGRNDYGLSTERAPLAVVGYRLKPIRVKVKPKSMRIEQGGTARFLCSGKSEVTSTITWERDDSRNLPNEAVDKHGVLTITNVQRRHSGLYTCVGSNQFSTDKVSVQLRVGVVVPPQAFIRPSYQTVDVGVQAEFRCSINGYPIPSVSWKRGQGKRMPGDVVMENGYLIIKNVKLDDEGDYHCIVTNRGGSVTRRAVLYIRGPDSLPTVTVTPVKFRVRFGSSVSFSCTSSGTSVTVKWIKENGVLPVNSVVKNGRLYITSVNPTDQGSYVCIASNAYGTSRMASQLVVTTGK